jgi:hypothetical protein
MASSQEGELKSKLDPSVEEVELIPMYKLKCQAAEIKLIPMYEQLKYLLEKIKRLREEEKLESQTKEIELLPINTQLEYLLKKMKLKREEEELESPVLNLELKKMNEKLEDLLEGMELKAIEDKLEEMKCKLGKLKSPVLKTALKETNDKLTILLEEMELKAVEDKLEEMEMKRKEEKLEFCRILETELKIMNDNLKYLLEKIEFKPEEEKLKSSSVLRMELKAMNYRLEYLLEEIEMGREEEKLDSPVLEMELEGINDKLKSVLEEMELKQEEETLPSSPGRLNLKREEEYLLKEMEMTLECPVLKMKLKAMNDKLKSLLEEMELKREEEKLPCPLGGIKLKREKEYLPKEMEMKLESPVLKMELKAMNDKLKSLLKEMELKPEEEELEPLELEMELKAMNNKLTYLLEEMELKPEEEKRESEVLKTELKAINDTLEYLLEEMGLEREFPVLEMELKAMNDKLEKVELKRKEEKLKSTLKLCFLCELREMKDKVKSFLERMKMRGDIAELYLQSLEMKLKAIKYEFKAVNVRLKGLSDSETAPQQQRTPSKPIESYIIVLGGRGQDGRSLWSVEGYLFREGRWIELPPMNTPRSFMAAVVVDNQIVVSGGDTGDLVTPLTDTIEILNLKETPLRWITSTAKLPVPLSAHQTVVYQGKLIVIGGHDANEGQNSDKIYEISLSSPYSTRILKILPTPTAWHGAELVNDEIFIFGGGRNPTVPTNSVLVYDLVRNGLREMNCLPYPVQGMATVNRGTNVALLGGVDYLGHELNNFITYDTKSGERKRLTPMKQKRGGCSAVIALNVDTCSGCSFDKTTGTLIALGSLRNLNTVERYDFHSHAWEDIPPTREARELCTAVVCPIEFEFER